MREEEVNMINTNSALAKPFAVASKNNTARYNLTQFVCDTENDIAEVPTTVAPGSTLFCIESSNTYMLNTKKEWVKISLNKAEGGSSEGAIPDEAFNLTGDLSYKFYGKNWNWFLEKYSGKIVLSNVTSLRSTFYGSDLSDLNIDQITLSGSCTMTDAFCNASIKRLPKIIGKIGNNVDMFSGLGYLEGELSDDFFDDMTLSKTSNCITKCFFNGWKRIKSTPLSVLSGAYPHM